MDNLKNLVAEVRTLDGELLHPGDPRLAAVPPMRLPEGFVPPALEPLGEGPRDYAIVEGAEGGARRADLRQLRPAERVVRDAMTVVEELGADPRLTAVGALLERAVHQLADYYDTVPTPREKIAEDLHQQVCDLLPWTQPWSAEDVAKALPYLEALTGMCRDWVGRDPLSGTLYDAERHTPEEFARMQAAE